MINNLLRNQGQQQQQMVAFVDANGNQVQQVQQMQDQAGNIVYADVMGNPVQQVLVNNPMMGMQMPDGSSTDQSVQAASNQQQMMGQQMMDPNQQQQMMMQQQQQQAQQNGMMQQQQMPGQPQQQSAQQMQMGGQPQQQQSDSAALLSALPSLPGAKPAGSQPPSTNNSMSTMGAQGGSSQPLGQVATGRGRGRGRGSGGGTSFSHPIGINKTQKGWEGGKKNSYGVRHLIYRLFPF